MNQCPTCGGTIERGAVVCPSCGSSLAPGPRPDPEIELTPIFRSGDPAAIAVARSLLDAEGIEYGVRGDGVQDLFGWGRFGTAFSPIAGPTIFIVRAEDAARARELLKDLEAPPL